MKGKQANFWLDEREAILNWKGVKKSYGQSTGEKRCARTGWKSMIELLIYKRGRGT